MASLHPYTTVWMEFTMRLPNTAHTSRAWRIHELTRDFRLEDVLSPPRNPLHQPREVVRAAHPRQRPLDEVLPEFVVNVFSGWLRRDFLHRIARIAEGSA